jgi:DNA-binding protein H-NS
MRLRQVIFQWKDAAPAWVKEAAARAKALVKHWKKAQITLNFAAGWTPKAEPHQAYPGAPVVYRGPMGETWSGRGLMPKWLHVLVQAGNDREQFRVQNVLLRC